MDYKTAEASLVKALNEIPVPQRSQLLEAFSAYLTIVPGTPTNPEESRINKNAGVDEIKKSIEWRIYEARNQAEELHTLINVISLKCDNLKPTPEEAQESYQLICSMLRLCAFHKEHLDGIVDDMYTAK